MKFYLIAAYAIVPKDHHIIIPFLVIFPFHNIDSANCKYWIINLTDEELEYIDPWYYQYTNFKYWETDHANEMHLWNFLKTKNTFELTGHFSDGDESGINSFDLNKYDLMYLKLLR